MNCGPLAIVALGFLMFAGLVMPMQVGSQLGDISSDLVPPAVDEAPPVAVAVPVKPSLSCDAYPVFCVPFMSDDANVPISGETPNTRTLDRDSTGAPGVIRGITAEGAYFLGDPAAPIRFKVFHNYGCGHCQVFANGDLKRFIETYVVTGQAGLEVVTMNFGTSPYPVEAAYAAMCAGDQGAYWEMETLLFEKGRSTLDQIVGFAAELGLDDVALRECIVSEQHAASQELHTTLAQDYGITGTPTVMVSVDGGEWTKTQRLYDNLVALTEEANGY